MLKVTGIYKITSPSGKVYIGQAAEARCVSKSMVTEHLIRLKVNRLDLIYV